MNLEIKDLKKGDFIKKNGSNIELKVLEVGKDWRSGYDYVKFENNLLGYTRTLIDISGYTKM